jgi:hypothetical protein
MDPQYSLIGFGVIVVLYAVVGLLAAAGTLFIVRQNLGARAEQVFFGTFLVLIAAFYLAFVAYFEDPAAWRAETAAVVVFTLIGAFGVRLPVALVVGYPLHVLWDLVHEVQALGLSVFEPGQLTATPLAYGVFCAIFDVVIAAYAYQRRAEWETAWLPREEKLQEPQEPRLEPELQSEPEAQPEPRSEPEATPPA